MSILKNMLDYTSSSHRGKDLKASALMLAHIIGWRLKLPLASCGHNFTLTVKKHHMETLWCRCGEQKNQLFPYNSMLACML